MVENSLQKEYDQFRRYHITHFVQGFNAGHGGYFQINQPFNIKLEMVMGKY